MNYPGKMLLTLLVVIGLVGVTNYAVDSNLVFDIASIEDDDFKARDLRPPSQRMYKPYHFLEFKPSAVIIGTSRSSALDPQHPVWRGETGYNFYLAGQGNFELDMHADFILNQPQVDKLLIGLDFTKFLTGAGKSKYSFTEDRILPPQASFRFVRATVQKVHDFYVLLFTAPGLSRSFGKIFSRETNSDFTRNGVWHMTDSAFSMRGLRHNYLKTMPRHLLEDHAPGLEFAAYERLLRKIYSHSGKVDTRILLTPVHMYWLAGIEAAGYLQAYQQWHHEVVKINSAIAAEHGLTPIPVYGFNDYLPAVGTPVAASKSREDKWYHDFSHMRGRFADKIMAAIWGESSTHNIGQQLTSENLDDYLQRVDGLRQEFTLNQNLARLGALSKMQARYRDRQFPEAEEK